MVRGGLGGGSGRQQGGVQTQQLLVPPVFGGQRRVGKLHVRAIAQVLRPRRSSVRSFLEDGADFQSGREKSRSHEDGQIGRLELSVF